MSDIKHLKHKDGAVLGLCKDGKRVASEKGLPFQASEDSVTTWDKERGILSLCLSSQWIINLGAAQRETIAREDITSYMTAVIVQYISITQARL